MSEGQSFWQRPFVREGGSSLSEGQQRVLQYIVERMDKRAARPFRRCSRRKYVRRNCSEDKAWRIVNNPASVQAATFRSEEFRI